MKSCGLSSGEACDGGFPMKIDEKYQGLVVVAVMAAVVFTIAVIIKLVF